MDVEQQDEWRDLRGRAEFALRRGVQLRRRGCRTERLAQILVMPSFSSWSSSEVFRVASDEQEEFIASRMTWDLGSDAARLATPVERLRHPRALEPTLLRSQHPLPHDAGSKIVTDASSLQVLLAPRQRVMGLDGTSYLLTLGDHFAELSVRWWERPPDNWAAVGNFAASLVQVVDSVVQSRPHTA
jgi:hypothetical protein